MAADSKRVTAECLLMDQQPYRMDERRRKAVLTSLQERCSQKNWSLLAAHVRTNHVHLVVEGEARPERMMNDLKSYASRFLNRMGLDQSARKRWARHGSTRWLWKPESVTAAIRYVIDRQGEPLAVLVDRFPRSRLSADSQLRLQEAF